MGTFAVNPAVVNAVAKGCPVAAELADGFNVQLVGATVIAVVNVTAAVVDELIVTVPARVGGTCVQEPPPSGYLPAVGVPEASCVNGRLVPAFAVSTAIGAHVSAVIDVGGEPVV
jgi:hypothetical protein